MKDKPNLIFDCDGTLIDSYGAITKKVYECFLSLGYEYDISEIRKLSLFGTVDTCLETLAKRSGVSIETATAAYKATPEKRDMITLYAGVKELLQSERFDCFVYTHRGISSLEIFEKLGILPYFTEIVNSSYNLKRKPDKEGISYLVSKYKLDLKKTFYVGDRAIDMECGKNAGVGTIFIDSAKLKISTKNADFVIEKFSDIYDVLTN